MFTVDDLQAMGLEQELLAGYYRVLATRSGLETFASISMNHKKLADHYYRVAQRVLDRQQMEGVMKRWKLYGLVLVVLMVLTVGSVGAQDVKPTNPPVVGGTVIVATGDGSGRVTLEAGATEDATPAPTETTEPPPTEEQPGEWREFIEVFMPYLTQIVIAVVIGLVALAGGAIVVAGNGMPKWARDMSQSAIKTGLDRAQEYVLSTPSKADDEMLVQLREMVDKLFADMQELKVAASPAPDPAKSGLSQEDIEAIRRRAIPPPPGFSEGG